MEGGGSILAEEKPRVGMVINPWRFFWTFRRFPKWGYPMVSSVIERIHGPIMSYPLIGFRIFGKTIQRGTSTPRIGAGMHHG
jgi:hypothetical protein